MKLLAIVLIAFSIMKIILTQSLKNSEIQIASFLDPDQIKSTLLSFLILDGLVGLFCGVYILFA